MSDFIDWKTLCRLAPRMETSEELFDFGLDFRDSKAHCGDTFIFSDRQRPVVPNDVIEVRAGALSIGLAEPTLNHKVKGSAAPTAAELDKLHKKMVADRRLAREVKEMAKAARERQTLREKFTKEILDDF